MELADLVRALLSGDMLLARQWVSDAARAAISWADVPRPEGLGGTEMAVAAGIAELLALRAGERAPAWVDTVPAAAAPVLLVKAAASMPRLLRMCEEEGPISLRTRGILAPPGFLTFA